MKRGDVFWAELIPRSGSEQAGRCPVVVVSHDGLNQTRGWMSIIVIPLSTSTLQAKRGPTVVALPTGAAGLEKPSVAVCHQVTTLDRAKLSGRVGTLSDDLITQVNTALKAALDLE